MSLQKSIFPGNWRACMSIWKKNKDLKVALFLNLLEC